MGRASMSSRSSPGHRRPLSSKLAGARELRARNVMGKETFSPALSSIYPLLSTLLYVGGVWGGMWPTASIPRTIARRGRSRRRAWDFSVSNALNAVRCLSPSGCPRRDRRRRPDVSPPPPRQLRSGPAHRVDGLRPPGGTGGPRLCSWPGPAVSGMCVVTDLPFDPQPEPMVVIERTARRHRHSWGDLSPRFAEDARVRCIRCDVPKDPAASRRGKSARNRGNAFEREVAAALGVRRVGQYGSPTDVEGDWIAVPCQGGAAVPERLWGWLPAARGAQLRAAVIGDAPASGGKRRVLIALDFDEFCAWFGKR